MTHTINALGWECPKPIIATKRLLDSMTEGAVLTMVDNKLALDNLVDFGKSLGYPVDHREEAGIYYVTTTKTKESEAIFSDSSSNLVIVITTNLFGQGSEEFGETLMNSYIYALTEVEPMPKTLIFVNSGVFLTTENSEAENSLQVLANSGVEIITCGACLNFYGLEDKLIIGSVSNMYQIAEKMNKATNTIKI